MAKTFLYGRGLRLQICIAVACEMAFMLMGYDQGVFSSVVSNKDFLTIIGNPDDAQLGIIVASYNLGCLAGSIFAIFFCERLGRRWSIWVAMAWIIVGAVLQCTAFSRAHLVVGRVICGVGTGIDTSTVPMYQAELSHAKTRGRLVASELLFVAIGIVIAYWYDYGMSHVANSSSWRLPIASQIVFAIVSVVMVFGIPESPRHLCKVGRSEEAIEVLSAVWDKPTDHEDIVREHAEIIEALRVESEHGEYEWKSIFKSDRVKTGRRVLLAYGVNFINQMCGINLVVYYMPTVLRLNVGMSQNMSQILGGVINITMIIGSIFPTIFADKYGRRKPMMLGSAGLCFSMMMVTIFVSFQERMGIGEQMSKVAVAFFFTFMLVFGMSINSLTWVYGPEVLPLHVRAKGNAIGISAIWLWNFVVVMITPVAINRIKYQAYIIFTVLNFSFIPMLYFFYPELANLTLEEVDDVFTAGIDPVKAAKEIQKRKRQRALSDTDDSSNQEAALSEKPHVASLTRIQGEKRI